MIATFHERLRCRGLGLRTATGRSLALLAALGCGTAGRLPAATGDVDPLFDPSPGPYPSGGVGGAAIRALAFDRTDQLIFAGQFNVLGTFSRNQFARLGADGSILDGASPTASGDTVVTSFAIQPDGKIVIGGFFNWLQGETRSRLARLQPDGSVESTDTFNTGAGFNETVFGAAIQPDGKLVVVGRFTTANGLTRNRIVRLNPDGSLDGSFDPGTGADNGIRCVALQGDGKILIGGDFLNFNGQARARVARLLSNGSLDGTFNIGSGFDNMVAGLVPQPDGKIVAAGSFDNFNGVSSLSIARLNADGSRDASFAVGAGFEGDVYALAAQADGKILVGGTFSTYQGVARRNFARINPDGSLDPSLAPDLLGRRSFFQVSTVGLQSDGRVVIGGGFSAANGVARNQLVRLLNDPAVDELEVVSASEVRWKRGGAAPEVAAVAFELSANGGESWAPLGAGQYASGTWTLSGISLPSAGSVRVRAHALCCTLNGTSSSLIERETPYNLAARPAITMESGPSETLANGGKWRFPQVEVAESASKTFTIRNAGAAELTGVVATLEGADAAAFEILTPPSTTVAANGGTTTVEIRYQHASAGHRQALLKIASNDPDDGEFRIALASGDLSANPGLASLSVSGASLVPAFSANQTRYAISVAHSVERITVAASPVDSVSSIAVQGETSGGLTASREMELGVGNNELRVVVTPEDAGSARTYTVMIRRAGAVAGDVESRFAPSVELQQGAGAGSSMGWATAVQPDGKLLIGGQFARVGGQTRNHFARIDASGVLEDLSTFNPGTGAGTTVTSLSVQPDGKILLGGGFTLLNTLTRNRFARILPDGTVEDTATFHAGTGADGSGCRAVLQKDGKILLIGDFATINGTGRSRIARLNPDGTLEATATFNPGAGANGTIWTTALQEDGKIVIGGDFTTFDGQPRNRIARLHPDGSLEGLATFDPGTGADAIVNAIAVQPDGKILAGGNFGNFAGVARQGLVRLQANGALENTATFDAPALGSSGNGVMSIALQADGRILAGGSFTSVGGQARKFIVRLHPNGAVDETWVANPDALVRGVMIEGDGSIILAGNFNAIGHRSRIRLARLWNDPAVESLAVMNASQVAWLRDGSAPELRDVTFDVSTDLGLTWISVGEGTRIAGGWEGSGIALPGAGWLRARGRVTGGIYNASSGLVEQVVSYTGVNPAPEISVERPLGTVIADGASQSFGALSVGAQQSLTYTIRNRGGASLTGIGLTLEGTDADQFQIATAPAETLPGLGDSTTFAIRFAPTSPGPKSAFLRIASNDEDENPFDLALTGNGISSNANLASLSLSRGMLNPVFSPTVTSFQTVVSYSTTSLLMTPVVEYPAAVVSINGMVVPSGSESQALPLSVGETPVTVQVTAEDGTTSKTYQILVRRASPNEVTLNESFAPGPDGPVRALAEQSDGMVIVGGGFLNLEGLPRMRLARIAGDGTVDPAFAPPANDVVNAVSVAMDGRMWVGGAFSSINGTQRNRLARLLADGSLDATIDPDLNGTVHATAFQADGKLIVGGAFTSAGGVARNRALRLLATGALDGGFDPDVDGQVQCVGIQTDGRILLGGSFSQVDGATRNRLARVDADGVIDGSFVPAVDGNVTCLHIQTDGRILIGGDFSTVNGTGRSGLARLLADGSLDASFNPGPNGPVRSMGLRADGKLLIAGDFTTVGGTPSRGLARLETGGALDLAFDAALDGAVDTLAILKDGGILIGGSFTTAGGMARAGLARLDNDGPTETLEIPDFTTVRWLRGGAGPEASSVLFDLSTDGGSNWTLVGTGSRISGGWQLSGLSLPFSGQIRARARTPGGFANGSGGLPETITPFGGIEPEIGVERSGVPLASGESADFGGLMTGTTSSATFTIRNTGISNLTGVAVTVGGTHATDFVVTASPSEVVTTPNGSTTFVVSFTPSEDGIRNAVLSIASNDSNENPYLINLSGIGASIGGSANPSYQSLNHAEYFIGSDPGEGNGTPLALTGADGLSRDLAEVTIPVGHLPAGTHEVKVRVRDEEGRWSNPLVRRFTVSSFTIAGGQDPETGGGGIVFPKTHQSLNHAECFIGSDPGEGNGTPLALTGADGLARDLAEVTIPIGHLPTGTHEVKVRVRDEAGRWSNPLVRRFTVSGFTIGGGQDPETGGDGIVFPKTHQALNQAEYFIGSDPGEGNGTPLALTGADGLARDLAEVTIPVGHFPAGTHEVKVRVRDEAGRWSNPLVRRFTVSSFTIAGGQDPEGGDGGVTFAKPYEPLEGAEWYVGADPGEGNGTPLALSGSVGMARDLSDVAIPLNLPPGSYDVNVRVRDEAGRWSNPLKRRFNLYSTVVAAAQRSASKLVDLEFDLIHGPRNYTVVVLVSNDGGLTWAVPTASVTGDVGANVSPGHGKKVVWHAGEDWDNGFSEDMRFRVIAYETVQDTPAGFVAILPGGFTMGSPDGEPGRASDEAERTVTMKKPFFIKNSEVTWTEWNAVRNQGAAYGYTDIAAGRNGLNGDATGNHPVTEVSWMDVVKWCNLRSEIEGRKPVYHSDASLNPATVVRTGIPTVHAFWNAGGYRLPSEAEWEYACRAGTTTAFHSGVITDTVTDPNLGLVGWYAANSGGNTRVVRGKPANARGLFDMHGNVREWCWDTYGTYASGPQWDPVTGAGGSFRAIRGGDWNDDAALCRSAARTSSGQNSRSTDIGFRIALNASGLTDLITPAGIPVDSRDAAAGNLIAGLRPAVNGAIHTALVLPDGKVLIAGDFTTVDGVGRNRLARLHEDGSLDASFNPGADSTIYCAAVLPDGKILLGGDFSTIANGPADFIARVHPDGTLDATFQPQVDYIVRCMAAQADGRIVIGGDFERVGGVARNRAARLHPDGALDTEFNPNADGSVRTLAIQSDGRILLGGIFAMMGGTARERLARVQADGSLDFGFSADADGEVRCLAVQSNGQIVVGGAFATLGGQVRSGLGRLSSSGVVDGAFDPAPNGPVSTVAVQADGKLLIGGGFTTVGGANRRRLACLDATGALQSPFALDFNGAVHTLNLLPNGKLLVGGLFGTVSGVTRQGMAWLDNEAASGTLAAMSGSRVRWLRGGSAPEASEVAFEISTDSGATWLPLGSGFRISGGWERTGVNLPAQGLLRGSARIPTGLGNGSGALVTSVAPFSGLVTIPEIAVDSPSGGDLADGGSHDFGSVTLGATRNATFVIRNLGYGDLTGLTVTKSGANPTDFQVTTAPVAPVQGPGGSTLLVVTFNPGDVGLRSASIHIANNDANESPFDIHLTATAVIAGQLADDFDPMVGNRVNTVAVQPDGRVLIGGTFTAVQSQPRGRFARLNPDLSIESTSSFAAGSGANSNVLGIAVQSDGKILLCGQFASINSQQRNRIARLLPDGSLEPTATFNPGTGPNNTVHAMAIQPDGKILLAGDFTTVNGQSRPRIARLNADGTLDTTFLPGTGANATVSAITLQRDGRILLGGTFLTIGGEPRQRLARLLADGTLDPDFVPESDDKVSCLAVQPDGRILVGGLFTTINGEVRNHLARLHEDGLVEDVAGFDPGTGLDGEVTSIVLQADRSILLGGAFTLINDEPRAGIARLYPNGTLETSITFDTVVGPDATVRGLALRPDGAVIAGGDFMDFNGSPRGRLALLANQPAEDRLVVSGASRVEWLRGGTAAEISAPGFELSVNDGAAWQALPAPGKTPDGWQLTGVSLPSSGIIRARGRTSCGLANGSSGVVQAVTGFVNPPVLATLPATAVTDVSATLNATIIPNGHAEVRFEYGPTAAYGSVTAVQAVSGDSLVEIHVPLTGLSGIYHFRVVAQTTGGVYQGEDRTFVTAPVPPQAVTANPVAVTTSGATLMGAVNPRSLETQVWFEYGSTALYGNTTTLQTLLPGNSAVEVSAPITGLAANATFHCRIVAVSSGGTAYGSDVTFQATSGGTPTAVPSVTTGAAGEITTVAAQLNGTVNPNGGFTNAFFEFGTTAELGGVSPNLGAGNGSVPAAISWNLAALEPGTLYHYRLVASNSLGTTPGAIQTFRTVFPPPMVFTGGAVPVGTTGAQVSGTVRARGAVSNVFLDYGTDGVSFPTSVSASPPTVDGDMETPVTADLANLQQGVTYHYRLRAVNSGGTGVGETGSFTPAILSGLARQFPDAPPEAGGAVTVNLLPAGIASGWRFAGERQWRSSGATADGMTSGNRVIEYRPVAGFIQPPSEVVQAVSGAAPVVVEHDYYETESPVTGGLTVVLKPDDLAAADVPSLERAQWRFLGDTDNEWRDSGATVGGLAVGSYLIECKPVAGRSTPPLREVLVAVGGNPLSTITYLLAPDPVGTVPVVQSFPAVSGDSSQPHGFVGQIRTSAGLSSGFVVKPRVVATAGHVVFDDGMLAFVTNPQWLLQRDRGTFEPTPQVPRGFYVFDGYAAQREAENTPGVSSPQSQNLDVAAMYFLEDAGRRGFSGFLASDTTTNEFLNTPSLKILAGYAVDGIGSGGQGRLFATPPQAFAFAPGFGRTHTTTAIRGSGGMSGGPLCVQHSNGQYYPAAVFLGGTAQTVVRAIDSAVIELFNRAEVSGNGGDNNTGGGITRTSFSIIGSVDTPAAIKVTILPEAANTAGAGWRIKPEASYRTSGQQKNGLSAGSYTIQYKAVPGFQTPLDETITVTGGQLAEPVATYTSGNTPPVISGISDLTIANQTLAMGDSSVSIPFTVGDLETAASLLILDGISSNPDLLPISGIAFGGSGEERNLTLTPTPGRPGSAILTITVSDGELTADRTFVFTVTGAPLETWRFVNFGSALPSGESADHADPDGDGSDNLEEFHANTDPNDPADVFRVVSATASGNSFSVVIPGKPGRDYTLQRAPTTGGPWQDVASSGALVGPREVTLTDPARLPERGFYRVMTQATP